MDIHNIECFYNDIITSGAADFEYNTMPFRLKSEGKKNISLTALIYRGDGFIPLSVRDVLKESFFNEAEIKTHLFIEEESHSVYLCYLSRSSKQQFTKAMYTFIEIASFWQEILTEKDEQDLVKVPIKQK